MKKQYLILIFITTISIIFSQDMDFGVFNYEGSRLVKMNRYRENKLKQEISYTYDDKGYLKSRVLTSPAGKKESFTIYSTEIKYDLSNDIITERFDRDIGGRIIPVILEYHYKDKKLVNLVRWDGNLDNDKLEITGDLNYVYNSKNDIIQIKEVKLKKAIPNNHFFPGNGIIVDIETNFKYEYFPDKKIRYNLYEKKYCIYNEFLYKNNNLVQINGYPVDGSKLSNITKFKYNDKNLISETKIQSFVSKYNQKITYEYDKLKRLIKRIIWFNRNGINEIDEVENYYYQDGKYIYYPYLLPPKIKLYSTQSYESSIDKFVF